jgi:hypothetical protein
VRAAPPPESKAGWPLDWDTPSALPGDPPVSKGRENQGRVLDRGVGPAAGGLGDAALPAPGGLCHRPLPGLEALGSQPGPPGSYPTIGVAILHVWAWRTLQKRRPLLDAERPRVWHCGPFRALRGAGSSGGMPCTQQSGAASRRDGISNGRPCQEQPS